MPSSRPNIAGTFTPPPAPAAPMVPIAPPAPQRPTVPLGPRRFAPLAWIALGLGAASVLLGFFLLQTDRIEDTDETLAFAALALSIAAVTTGIVAIVQINRRAQELKGLAPAIVGLVLGGVVLLYTVFVVLFVLFLIWLCCSTFGGNYALLTAGHGVLDPFRMFFANTAQSLRRMTPSVWLRHHPECQAFERDVVNVGGVRVCAGCLGLVASAPLAYLVLRYGIPDVFAWQALLAGGVILSVLAQLPSALGSSSPAWVRSATKGLLGVGLAAGLVGLELSALDPVGRFVVLLGGGLLVLFFFVRRGSQQQRRLAQHPHTLACAMS